MMNSNTPKYIFLGLIVAMILCFVMGGVTLRRDILSRMTQPHTAKPSPFDSRTYPPPPAAVPERGVVPPRQVFSNAPPPVIRDYVPPVASPGLPTPGKRLGKFEGQTLLEERSIVCGASFEIYDDAGQSGHVVAYETLSCADPMAMFSAPKDRPAIRGMVMRIAGRGLPVKYVLSGERQAGGVVPLKILKAVGIHDKCAMTTGTLTPFGYRQILFEWEDGACGKGEMLLTLMGT